MIAHVLQSNIKMKHLANQVYSFNYLQDFIMMTNNNSLLAHNPTRIQITVTHSSLDFFYALCTPTIVIDGVKYNKRWGTHLFDVSPGSHHISISYPWLFSPECGKNSVNFPLSSGEIKKIHYCAGLIRFVPGKIYISN
jgi:hypothetical protein